jgi:hypothetical protein
LFLCDSPTSHPYLSSLIFTSFVVLTGFMLISLTVAAVSDGVNMRLIEIQKQQQEEEQYERDEELLENLLDAEAKPVLSDEKKQEILKTWKTFASSGKGNQSKQKKSAQETACEEVNTRESEADLRRMESLEEQEDEEEEDCDLDKVLSVKKRSLHLLAPVQGEAEDKGEEDGAPLELRRRSVPASSPSLSH